MHRSFIITEEERNRILGNHINATKKQYLTEEELFRQNVEDRTEIVDASGKFVRMFDASKGDGNLQDFNWYNFHKANPNYQKEMQKMSNTQKQKVNNVQNKKVVTTNTNVQSIQSKLKELGVELGKNANGYLNQQTLNAIYAQLDKINTNTKTEAPTTDNKTPVDNKNTTDTKTPTTDNKVSVNTTGNEGGEATSDMS